MKCGELKIDIGCGRDKKKGYIGIDIGKAKGVDIVRDIEKRGLPFCDNSATEIRAISFLEHLSSGFIFVMNECRRVLKKGGKLYAKVPYAGDDASFRDPTHRTFFTPNTFEYFERTKATRYPGYGIKPWTVKQINASGDGSVEAKTISFILTPDKEDKATGVIHGVTQLNIGCGEQRLKHWIGLDKADYGQRIVRDLVKGIPACNNSVEKIMADSILEHIETNEDFIFVMNECLRVLKRRGTMYIRVPHWRGQSRHKDLTHCRDFDEASFSFLEPANRWKYGFDKRWKVEKTINHDNQILEVLLVANK